MAEEEVDMEYSPQIRQEYTFRHRSACRTAADQWKRIYRTT